MIKSSPTTSVSASSAVNAVVENQATQESHSDGWLEVGKKNRTVVTRTVE